ncbi:hypothetical protein ABPG74_016214, partial [Tetrahymena malaccensis]
VQFYKSIIKSANNIQVFIEIDPNNPFNLISQLTNFSFKSLISLTISSNSDQQLATIQYEDSLIFEDYNSINLFNIQVVFLNTNINQCGLEFSNIQNIVQINNIQLQAYQNPSISCQRIKIINSYVQIQNYTIYQENFSNSDYIFSTLNTNQISISNFTLVNCQFGDNFSILQQNTDVQAIVQNIKIENNFCQQDNSVIQTPTALFSAGHYTVSSVLIQNNTFYLIDHFDIQLGAFVESSFISIYNFNCSNNQVFLKQLKDQQTQGCIVINEATLVIFDNVQANFKKAQDNSLFLISNSNYKSSQVNISNIQFTNLILNQTSMNTFANPFQIIGSYQINLNIQNSQFINNSLISLQYSLTYSTSGLWFENFVGQAIIYNTTFENNYSNSIYNNIHIQSDSLIIDLCTFKNSTFTEITLYENNYKQLFSQQGGMINGIVNSLIINNSLFQQSTASIGSFLYIQAFGNNLNIFIRTTKFIEGYGQIDGGAMYINPINNLLNFSCTDCEFTNIYSLNELSSQIQIIQQNQKNGTNNITFIGGIIQTIQGISDNYFIKATFSQIEMIGISQITNQVFNLNSLPFLIYQTKQNRQQSTFIYSQYSQLIINNCNISNLSITNYQSSIPLIIQSQNSTITISSTSISNCEFSKNMVQLNGGKLILDNILFNNIQSYIPTQILSNDQLLKPSSNQNSVIATSDTYIQIQNNSSFSNLTCLNCNGGLLQILNGSMNIQNSLFYSIKSNYGGVFFIIELYGTNNILNSQFQNCQSIFDGGVAYVQFNSGNQLSMNINSTYFFNNTSLNGKGGAIYVFSQNLNPQFVDFTINNSNFTNNQAQIGAAIYEQNISLQINTSQFYDNYANIFGRDTISYATKLKLVNIEQFMTKYNAKQYDDYIEINDFRSGDTITNISFKMMNSFDEIIFPVSKEEQQTYSVQVKVNPNTQKLDSYQISGDQNVQYNISTQSFTFSSINIVGTPGSYFRIQFYSNQILVLNQKTNQYEQNYTFEFVINFRKCISGEQQIEYNNLYEQSNTSEQKKFNPEIKAKIKRAFQRYLQMDQNEKKKFFLNILESRLLTYHKDIFADKSLPKIQTPFSNANLKKSDKLDSEKNSYILEQDADLIFNSVKTNNFQTLEQRLSKEAQKQQNKFTIQNTEIPNSPFLSIFELDDPIFDYDLEVYSFLRIPMTNILLINTIDLDNQSQSIVYYADLSSPSKSIINVVKHHSSDVDVYFKYQYFSQIYNFTCLANQVIISSNEGGIIAWGINLDTMEATYYGVIDYSKLDFLIQKTKLSLLNIKAKSNYQSYYNRFEKYPDQDILFIGGQNYELTAIKVLQFQKGQYKKMMHTYLFRGTVSTYIENIMFQYVQTNQQNQTVLFVADRDQINYLELNVDLQNNIISAPLDYNPDYWNVVSYFQWYHMQGTSQIYMSYSTSPMNTSSFQINWENIGNNFDPFYYNNYTWIVVAFPNKNNLTFEVNGLFYLINAQNTSEYYALTSPDQNYNIQNTSFAVASIEDLNNPEIIGVDTKGNVYSWDLLSPTYNFKFSLQLQRCFNSQIGEIFQYNQNKKLIIFCDDYSIYSFDLQTSDQQFLLTLTSIPISIRAFNSIQMIAIPDFISGILYLYKYNIKTNIFVYHLTLSESQLPDYLYHVELLRDNTLWVQYKYSFVFYQIDTCLDNPISCTNCQQNYFFNITNNANDIGIYGQGNFVDPYTTSQSYFQAIINAQYYSSIITDVINIQVLIEINPKNLLFLNPQLFEFRNKQIIQLTLKSTSDSQLATIICQNALLFDGYNNIKLYDIQILFLNANQNCGIQFSNINSTVIINNIQLVAYQNPQISCQSIIINNSQIQVQRYVINSENFTNNNFIFQTQNSNEINITNLSLVNCQFGEQFSILQQNTDLNATLQNILLQNNYCSQNNPVESNPTSLFSAGHYSVSSVLIINNTFCNKNIFQTVASIKHSNQTFSFQNISMLNNQFLSRTLYLLLESMYSVLSDPSHQLLFYDCKFQNNSLFQKSQRDLNGSSLVQTNKIQNVILQNITFIDHIDILLGTFEYLQQISVNNFNCSNDIEYLQAFYDGQTQGCIQINEATSIQLESLQVNHKKAQDNSLILISNYNYKQSQISINNSNFTNLILNQTQKNTFANPIQIIGSFQINLNIQNNLFTNNALSSLQFSLTYSTTGLWFENFQGSITILNSTFDNNFSNSIFNNLHLQSNATAFSGSFLYIKSFGQNLNIFISSTQFTEGYSQIDGGAIYIDPQTNLINFTCIQCEFKNIYSFSKQSSSIYMMQLNQLPGINNVTFIGGIIQTIQGIQDNYFIKVTYTQLTLTDIPQLTHESFSSKEMPFLIYQRQLNQQQSSLIYLENSQLFMKNCNISNLSIKNVQSTSPLIVYSLNSNVTIVSSSISNCQYIQNLMFLQGGLLEFNNIQLNNIQNNLQFKIDQQVQSNLNSIILAQNSKISILNNSSFYQLQCIRCYGGFLQIINGNINIQNSSFRQISSYQGGVFFINGLHGNNSIKNATFQDCQSQQNAGVSYISLQDGIQTNLNIDSTNFINNTSIYGRGGAVYVSTQNINPLYINFNINNTIFKNNFAQIGAAVFQQNISLLIQNSFFVNNQAQIFGRDEISYPSKLKLVFTEQFNYIFDSQQYDDSLQVMNFRSGDVLTSIHFQMVNDLDEIIFPVNYEEYKTYSLKVKISHYMQNLESYLIDGDLFVNYDKLSKSFTFPKLKIIGIPGSSLKIQFFNSSSRYTMSVSFIIAQYNIHINITFFISFKYMIVPRLDQGQYVQNVVKIPNTNIMVVNTLQYQNQDKSIVYFVDMTIPSGSIVQIIQPPYVILQLIYAYKTNQFLITNYNNIIVADIFTLSPINILFYENIWNISHIQNSDLVILTAKYQFLYIFDLVKMNVVQTLQNNDPQFPQLIQYQSQLYALSLGIQLIITSTNQYLYGWIVDSTSYKPILQKQISGTNFTASTTSQFQVFAKEPSPSQDIIFYSTIGTNQISSFLIKNDQLDINQEGTYSIQNTSELIAQIFCFDSTQIYIVSNNQLFTVAFTISQQSLSFTQNSEAYLFQDTKQKITQAYYDGYHFIIVSQDTSALYNRISLIQQSNHAQIPNILYFDTKIGYRQFIYESSPNSNSNVVYYGLFSQNNLFKVYIRSNNTQNQINQQNQQVNLPQQLTIFDNSSSLYPVKNKLYSIIIKAQDNNNKPYIVIIDQTDLTIQNNYHQITSVQTFQNWDNQKLDPFCFNSNYYMIIYSSGYFLIQIDGNQSFQISTSSTVLDQNSIFVISTQSQKVYAINSQKIIIWKINSIITSAPEDDAIPLSNCDKPLIAEEFQQSQGYILIISCQNQSLLYYDLNTKNSGTIQLNSQAQEAALFIKSFSILLNQQSLNILVLGGNKSNNVYILQFNQNTGKFEIILTITSGQLQDIPNYVDLLSDQTLWIQYKYSNLFYPLQNCLLSPNNCQNCQFKVTISEQPQSNQDTLNYGANNSYYTGSSILVALLQAKYYQAIQPLQTQISLELDITAATIPTNYFNFDKSSITSLNIKSSTSSTSIISYQGQIVFNQYTSITISNIQFKFTSSQYPNCGLVFQNVTSISFTPISITTDSQNQNCYNVIANSTVSSSKFQITGMTIQNLDFTNNNQIILSNGYDIQIDSLNLSGCTLGDNFSIITQTQGNYINLSNSYIQSNKCVSNWSSGTIASALFKGSQIIVKSLQILDNTFCNKLIFQSLQFNLGNQDQIANLDTITIKNNQFATISPTVFYYTFQQQPQNIILLNQLTFEKNTINSISKLPYATYISLFNIQTVTVTIVNINQEYSFQFTNMTSINSLTFTNINFINDPNFQSSTPLNNIPSCFQLYEIQNANLNTIKASYKNSVDQPLILIKNIQVQNSQISFSSGEFQNLNLNQPSFNTNASPIQISSVFQLNLTIDGIVFQNNNLIVNSFPSVYSASALWIENQQGNNTIQNSQFLNTYSNSHYNFIFCFGNNVTINTCTFQNSSFVAPPQTNLFVQRGGMIHIKTSNLNIYQSTFTQATAFKGSFMYVKSVGNPTLVNIQQTKFTEGYAFLDGGAFYFDNLGVQLNFTCQNCIFKNIFTMYMGAAVIGFEPQGNIQIKDLNQITLDGGSILNMYGVQDNSFIETYYAKIKISNIQNIGVVSETPSQSAAYSQYQQMQQQQTSILNILNGEATIQNCGISNFQIKNSDSTYSLFVTAVNSNITLDTVVIQDSLFYQNAFQITKGSTLNLINTKITNVNQYVQSSRLLQSLVPTYTPSQQSYSLIEVDGSTLNISNNSLISKIVCKSICNGIIQITNSSMNADSSTISLSQSNFGGAIFVRSFTGTNNWNSLTLDSNSASYDGGALYFSALTTDKFKLTLNQCTISNNKSINGRGGGMYITSQVSNSPNQSIVLKDTQILNNNAKVGGGMQYTNISPQIKGNTVFKGNKAFYFGSDSFSYPSHLYLQNYTQANNQVIINQFRSGGPLNNLTFEFQNDKNEKILPVSLLDIQSYSIQVQIDPNNQNFTKYTIRGDDTIFYSLKTQSFTFSQLIFVGTPGTTLIQIILYLGIFNVPNSVGSPLKSSLNSLDCALLNIGGNLPMVYLRLIFSMFLPIIYFTLFIGGITLIFYINKYRSAKKEKQQEKQKADEKNKNNQLELDIKNKEKQNHELFEDSSPKKDENQSSVKQKDFQIEMKNQNEIQQNQNNEVQEQKYKLKGDTEQNLDIKNQSQRKMLKILESYLKKLEPVIDKICEKFPFLKKCFKKKPPKKFEPKTKERLRSIFQKYLDMDDQQRKKLFVNVFEKHIDDKYQGSYKSKQNTKNMIISSQISSSGKNSHSNLQHEDNEDIIIPSEKNQQDIQIKHQDTKNLTSVYNLLQRYPTESTPVNYNPSPFQHYNSNHQEEEASKQINLN